MCGIAGVCGGGPDDSRPLPAMTAALRHRGPDDEGYLLADTRRGWAQPFGGADTVRDLHLEPWPAAVPAGADVALGCRRLAIIDLTAAGHQPMPAPGGRFWVAYNGEIFNYRELRAELEGLGHAFRTGSDTEVLLAAWSQWGPEALHRFNGMWAFALYDARQRTVFCARDRFGVKPFHYFWDGDVFAFASEIKGLLAHPRVPRRPHDPALRAFLVDGAMDEGEETFFAGILRLGAGRLLTCSVPERRLAVSRWYALPEPAAERRDPAGLRALLEDAVRLRLRSDVDVGTCLSGGLDSSSIVALTARLRGDGVRTARRAFTVTHPDAEIDESAHAAAVVAATGVQPARTTPTSRELLEDLPALARAQDEPFASSSVYAQWRVMRLARETGVTVLLDGQGADEVLAGYHYHFGPLLAEIARSEGWPAALAEARQAHRVTGRPLSFFLGLLAYHGLPVPAALRARVVARAATQSRLPRSLLDPAFAAGDGGGHSERHRPRPSLAEERRAEITSTSLPALLRYEDRNSMAFSVEARTPFLDYRLVEWALALPARALIRDGWTKAPLREAMRGALPETVRLRRDKIGFATPESRWLREIAPQVREWLGPAARTRPLLRRGRLQSWLSGLDGARPTPPGLWRLLSVELWCRHALSSSAEATPARERAAS
ncbi:MAG TPA: asparagine synthase (glutamine-hydrolyzing) [Vicinamibacteria bacterium]